MTQLARSLGQWGQPAFERTLKQELQQLKPNLLPLQYAVTEGGLVDDSPIEAGAPLANKRAKTKRKQ